MKADDLADLILDRANGRDRFVVALAGPPASGKTTLTERLFEFLEARGEKAVVVAMDGFHLDNDTLSARGHLSRKGAPFTFDGEGFVKLLERIASGKEGVSVPGFDRTADTTVADVSTVSRHERIVLVEGNYLLLDSAPWNRLAAMFDLTVAVQPPLAMLEERLIRRWLDHGHTLDAAKARAEANDLPNARVVLERSVRADITL